jgi:hypothetical protein
VERLCMGIEFVRIGDLSIRSGFVKARQLGLTPIKRKGAGKLSLPAPSTL